MGIPWEYWISGVIKGGHGIDPPLLGRVSWRQVAGHQDSACQGAWGHGRRGLMLKFRLTFCWGFCWHLFIWCFAGLETSWSSSWSSSSSSSYTSIMNCDCSASHPLSFVPVTCSTLRSPIRGPAPPASQAPKWPTWWATKVRPRRPRRELGDTGFLGNARIIITGWWFGTWILFFQKLIRFLIIPIDFHIFQRGGPTTNQFTIITVTSNKYITVNSNRRQEMKI